MAKITNTAEGPRGVDTADGVTVFIDPGQTADVEVAKGHKLYDGLVEGSAAAKSAAKAAATEPKPLAKMNKTELTAVAAAEGVAVEDGDSNSTIVEAIEKVRAAAQ